MSVGSDSEDAKVLVNAYVGISAFVLCIPVRGITAPTGTCTWIYTCAQVPPIYYDAQYPLVALKSYHP